jgi:hypothetical protein
MAIRIGIGGHRTPSGEPRGRSSVEVAFFVFARTVRGEPDSPAAAWWSEAAAETGAQPASLSGKADAALSVDRANV